MKSTSLIIFLSLLVSCGKSEQTPSTHEIKTSKIYGGDIVKSGQWPSVVAIAKLNSDGGLRESFCTGTLIDQSTVLTAAHCFSRNLSYYKRKAVITRDNVDAKDPRISKIKAIILHPKYQGKDSSYDFALVKVESAFEISAEKIIAPSKKKTFEARDVVRIVGFGKRENGESGIKFEAGTVIREDQHVEFTAGGKGKDTCSGDSGGPVFQKNQKDIYEFVGVTSRTPDDASVFCGDKTIYGKVSVAMKWVEAERLIAKAIELSNEESIKLLEKSLQIYPRYFKAYLELGKVYLKFRNINKASRNFLNASLIKADNIEALDNLAKIHAIQEDKFSEITILSRLIVLSPNTTRYFERLVELGKKEKAEISRGIGRFQKGDLHLAKLDLLEYPNDSFATFTLAFLYLKIGEAEKALQTLKSIKTNSIAAVNMKDKRGDTILLTAVFEGHLLIIKELMRFSPNLSVRDGYGNSLTEAAWWSKKLDIIDFLISKGVPFEANNYFEQFLSMISFENMEVVNFLLAKGIDTTLIGPEGATAQILAKETQNQELIELINSYTPKK
ncbi:hypothetical protein A9Q84_03335 [Halobacteriovorax marinus]|uniref:Peptidase S1 domain-containing protein n=1 Tax=Halobacteriovorax marinus TaxID=97084 RepID=A0A1Y5FA92_9BACT|nr:hypothetical protein A9Q84_03335 [Halobacteriovorax marinus]